MWAACYKKCNTHRCSYAFLIPVMPQSSLSSPHPLPPPQPVQGPQSYPKDGWDNEKVGAAPEILLRLYVRLSCPLLCLLPFALQHCSNILFALSSFSTWAPDNPYIGTKAVLYADSLAQPKHRHPMPVWMDLSGPAANQKGLPNTTVPSETVLGNSGKI